MRIKQVVKQINHICKITSVNIVNPFILYDKIGNSYKILGVENKNAKIYPVCIRQEYFSHMVIFVTGRVNNLYYFDPCNKKCPTFLTEILKTITKCEKIIQIDNKHQNNSEFDCVNICLGFLLTYIKDISNGECIRV